MVAIILLPVAHGLSGRVAGGIGGGGGFCYTAVHRLRAHAAALAVSGEDDDLATREARRRARLLGDQGTDSRSGFDDLFASLRVEEERAVAAAEAEAMTAFLTEVDGDLLDAQPPAASSSRRSGSRRGGGGGGGSVGLRSSRQAKPLYNAFEESAAPREPTNRVQPQQQPPLQQQPPAPSDWQNAGSGGLESQSVGGQLNVLMPTKVMVFIDGTWLYYQLFGRGRRCEITRRSQPRWGSKAVNSRRLSCASAATNPGTCRR